MSVLKKLVVAFGLLLVGFIMLSGLSIYSSYRAAKTGKSSGLGAVEVEFDMISMWNQSSPLDLLSFSSHGTYSEKSARSMLAESTQNFNTEEYGVSGYPLYSSGEPSYPWTRAVGGEDRGN